MMIGLEGNVNIQFLYRNSEVNFTSCLSKLASYTNNFLSLDPNSSLFFPFCSTNHEPPLPLSFLQMGWLQSLFSPLKKLWIRLHSAHKKGMSPSPSIIPFFFIIHPSYHIISYVHTKFHNNVKMQMCLMHFIYIYPSQ